MATEPPILITPAARRRSWLFKLISIGAIGAALLVPLGLTRGVLRERQMYQAQATSEITSVWGREQRVIGPVLEVPYVYTKGTVAKSKVVNGHSVLVDEPAEFAACAYFLPDDLQVEGTVDPEIRHRGIYDAVVYTTRLKLHGNLRADFAAAGIEAQSIQWDKARVLFGISDLHGLRSVGPLHLGAAAAAFEAVDTTADTALPLAAKVSVNEPVATMPFSFDVVVQGSGTIKLAPVGKTTTTQLRSAWRDPSFVGAWLPTDRTVNDGGFTAEWKVAQFSRGFPQSWSTRNLGIADVAKQVEGATFGVRFGRGVDSYSVVDRAQKYGVLFVALVFAVFFLFEATAELRIHPLQYGMVGAALCLFFLAFLALSELWGIGLAYATAAAACTALVSLYAWTFLKSGIRTLVVLVGLTATYGYLFFVLKSEDYALVAGTAALFVALALAMFCTRRINWYALDEKATATAG